MPKMMFLLETKE